MNIDELVSRFPGLNFLKSPEFKSLSKEKQDYVLELVQDVLFWKDVEKQPNSGDGFKFIAAAYGLQTAEEEANTKGLEGKEREKFLRPHQDLYTMFNPYSGNGRELQKAPTQESPAPSSPKTTPIKKK